MNKRQKIQNYLNSLASINQYVFMKNLQKKYGKQQKGESLISNEENIIPHPSCVCSLGFAQNLRQFNQLNRVTIAECQFEVQDNLQYFLLQKIYPQISFGKIFKKNIATQRIAQQFRELDNQRQFIEWPNISQSQVYIVELPSKGKSLQISIQDLLTLKQRKIIPERLIRNCFSLLKQSGRINERIEITSFAFLPTLLQGFNQNQPQESIIQTVRKNYEKATKCLRCSILQKTLTAIPFIVNDHYSMVVVKGLSKILTKRDQKAVLIYCSSRYIANKEILLAIKTFIQIDTELNYGKGLILTDKNLQYTQLILPKQVYSADSGLFLMLYCENLLAQGAKELDEIKQNHFGFKLNIFRLSFIEQMRAVLWNFYYKLTNARDEDKMMIIEEYFQQRKDYQAKAYTSHDYSILDQRQIKKLQVLINGKVCQSERENYEFSLEMHYNTSLNYFVDQ